MVKEHKRYRIRPSIVLLLLLIVLLTICGRSCQKKKRKKSELDTTGGSTTYAFLINAPYNLTARTISSSQIDLEWVDNSLNNDGFAIERKTWATGTYVEIARVDDIMNYSDTTGLLPLITYYYRVRAYNTIDYSYYSNEASATTSQLPWATIAVGGSHTLASTIDGTPYAWGLNTTYQLGLGDTINRSRPSVINSDFDWYEFRNINFITGGYYQSFAIKDNGTFWGWGQNGSGQLGLGYTESPDAPVRVGYDTDWSIVTTSEAQSFAIKSTGTLWGWGANDGLLGIGDMPLRTTPTQVGTSSNWVAVATATYHTIGRKSNSTIWAWGLASSGALGLGSGTASQTTPKMIGTDSDWAAIAAAGLEETGETDYIYYNHSMGLKTNGTIWSWGCNNYGQLGLGSTISRNTPTKIGNDTDWSVIAAGGYNSFGIKINNTLFSWGVNSSGQLGLGDSGTGKNRNTPTQVGTDSDWFIVAGSGGHTIGLKTDRTMWVWGSNNSGQLGTGDGVSKNVPCPLGPPPVPSALTVTLVSSLRIDLSWADSDNEEGFKIERKINTNGTWQQINTVGIDVNSYSDIMSTPIMPATYYYYRVKAYNAFGESNYCTGNCVSISGNWSGITAGKSHAIGRKTDNIFWCWGNNSYGQFGRGNTTSSSIPVQMSTETDWSEIAEGENYTIALKVNRTIWAWGVNNNGQLGLADTINRTTPSQISIASDWSALTAGKRHTLSIKTNYTIWAWGYNESSQLGLVDTINRTTPSQIGIASDWSMVVAGDSHTVSIKTNNTLWAWGANSSGQLGDGTWTGRTTPRPIGNASDWSKITAGADYTISIKTNNTIWVWGVNSNSQLGLGDTISRTTPSQIGIASDWSRVVAGDYHTISIKTNNTIWGWGVNNYGQLGLGDNITRDTPSQISTASDWLVVNGINISGFAARGSYTLSLKTNGTLWAWGRNDSGQLGLGDRTNRNIPMLVGE